MTGLYQFLKKYGVAISFSVGAVLVAAMYLVIGGSLPEVTPDDEELYGMASFDFGIYVTYLLIGAACLLVALFSLAYVIRNPKESVKGLVAFAILVILFGVTYTMGDGYLTAELIKSDPTLMPVEEKVVDGETVSMAAVFKEGETQSSDLQMADGLIKYGYIMLILASAAMVFAMVRDLIKK